MLLRTKVDLEAGLVDVRRGCRRIQPRPATAEPKATRMDPRLLRLYSGELTHLREVGAEFAHDFPKIAARLGMEGLEVVTPMSSACSKASHFSRPVCSSSSRPNIPASSRTCSKSIYPQLPGPTPSMMVLRMKADLADPNLVKGYLVPRGAQCSLASRAGQNTQCEFRTAHEVTLWPIEIASVHTSPMRPTCP